MANRIVVWFSSGAASAVAAKIAVDKFKDRNVEVVNVNMDADEHSDNIRFRADVGKWIGREIIEIHSEKYASTEEVFLRERFIVSPHGAPCTTHLKRKVQMAYQKPDDEIIVGFTSDERDRIDNIEEFLPHLKFLWVLADARISKEDCYKILTVSGIELPVMYKLGYNHNNCLGCVKGGKAYWNQIRRDFPEVFARRAFIEREVGFPILGDVYLDELNPQAGRNAPQPRIECGLFCEGYNEILKKASEPNAQETSAVHAEPVRATDANT
jgi:hypothetical protein